MRYVISVMALILAMDAAKLKKNADKVTIIVYAALFIITAAVCVVYALGYKIPSPVMMLGDVIRKIGLAYPHE